MMANQRKSYKRASFSDLKQIALVLVGLWLASEIIKLMTSGGSFILFFVLAGVGVIFLRLRKHQQMKFDENLNNAMQLHENGLISYFHQTRSVDHFGNLDDTKWQEKIDIFLKTQVIPECRDYHAWRATQKGQIAAQKVSRFTHEKVAQNQRVNPLAQIDASSLTPSDYERYCGDILMQCGWAVQLTKATRDGGADFIAEKDGHRLVAQCKRYAQPVGNKAVQEVHSAVRLYNGNIACVIAPMGFTAQAQREAHSLQIGLLHHSALQSFAEQLNSPALSRLKRHAAN
jgi:restriction system protein